MIPGNLSRPLLALPLAAALLLGGATAATAHDVWLMPSKFHPAVDERVALRLFVGEGFEGESLPHNPAGIESFALSGPLGDAVEIAGAAGLEPFGVAVPTTAGRHLATYRGRPRQIELAPTVFEKYLAEEGLERISELRRQRGQSDSRAREAYSRCAQTVLAVGRGPGGPPELVGCTFELGLETDPYAATAPATITVRALLRSRPLAGVRVVAIPQVAPEEAVAARSGEDGRVSLSLDTGGPWLIKAVHMEESDAPDVDWRSWWASITFELPAGAD